MTTNDQLQIWTITKNPSDLPQYQYVARMHISEPGKTYPTGKYIANDSLEELRKIMQQKGLQCIARDPQDDPVIVESWL